ncbi:HAD-IA family hydrolase [Candidatus Gracilibacteria bacterium]|nr:HAD-IA family hydrolase [Candidatus Gracilibacteria bacterium]
MGASTHILFDIDGVLIHTETWSSEHLKRNLLPPDTMKDFFGGVFRDCTIGKADLKDILPPFLEKWGYRGNVDEYLKEWFDFENSPDPELMKEIQKLRTSGIKCSLATNQEKYRLEYIQKEMKFDSLFDGIFCSCEIGLKKPQKEYYEYILDSLSISGEDVLYFDDSLENIEVARSIGINSILYRNREDFTQAISSCI